MSVNVTCTEIGYNLDFNGWRFDFLATENGRDIVSVPIVIPDFVPKNDRRDQAIENFRALIDAVAEEAKNL